MSLPTFPQIDEPLTTEKSIDMILRSISLEELALGRIIEAESEKLRHVIAEYSRRAYGCDSAGIGEIRKINQSIGDVLEKVSDIQLVLKNKLKNTLSFLPKPQDEPAAPCTPPSRPSRPSGRSTAFQIASGSLNAGKALTLITASGRRERRGASKDCRIILAPGGIYDVAFDISLKNNCGNTDPAAIEFVFMCAGAETSRKVEASGSRAGIGLRGSLRWETPPHKSGRLYISMPSKEGAQLERGAITVTEVF